MTGAAARRLLSPPRPTEGAAVVGPIKEWKTLSSVGQSIGSDSAPITILEFSDFQCPFCLRLSKSLRQLLLERPLDVRVVFRNFPLEAHRFARPAAIAAQCAADQGRFREYHDLLFALADSVQVGAFALRLARRVAGLDTTRFIGCLGDSVVAERIDADVRAATGLGVDATPTVIIAGLRLRGTPPLAMLDSLVNVKLAELGRR